MVLSLIFKEELNKMKKNRIFDNILDTSFDTPLVNLSKVAPEGGAKILLKLEYFNPLSSVKDRVASAMIEAAEQNGWIHPETRIVESTTGSMGISLAFVAAVKGLRLTLVMPESVCKERQNILKAFGIELILTPANLGMLGAIRKVQEIRAKDPNVWIPQQFDNPANPGIHEATTGPEIWRASGGKIDIFLTGVGTGGTFTGVSRYLRRKNPGIRTIAIEPVDCPVLSGGKPGSHGIQGIGPGFIPKNLDPSLLSGIESATTEEAYYWARRLAKEEGLLVGISTGANLAVASRLAARRENIGKTIVSIAPSCGERYLSTGLYAKNEDLTIDE